MCNAFDQETINIFSVFDVFMFIIICDLSRENVPYGIRSNGRTHGMWTDDKRIEKPFKTDAVNGWTASEKFRTVEVERLNG